MLFAILSKFSCTVDMPLLFLYVSAILLHTGAVKLGGVGPGYAGRFMIKYGGIWGTVSDDNFDDDDAKVACYMLGFGYVRLKVFQA